MTALHLALAVLTFQVADPPETGTSPPPAPAPVIAPGESMRPADSPTPPGSALGLTGRSLLLPGWGQYTAGRGHWWAYAGVEAVAWSAVIHHRREGSRFRRAYRDLAWEAARSSVWDGPRTDGPWSYYERMGAWSASGRFDRAPGEAELHPETDEATYNGMIWRLARDIHFPPGPGEPGSGTQEYQRALDYYRSRAIPRELAWDWEGDETALTRFRGLVRESDRAFRTGTTFVGLALVNRFIAGAEMWVAAHPGPLEAIPFQLRSRLEPTPGPTGWQLRFRVRHRPGEPGNRET